MIQNCISNHNRNVLPDSRRQIADGNGIILVESSLMSLPLLTLWVPIVDCREGTVQLSRKSLTICETLHSAPGPVVNQSTARKPVAYRRGKPC